jgi:hypothetical protein
MGFPISPTNGQTATVNGITYIYASATTSWKKVTSSVGNLTITGTFTANNSNLTLSNVNVTTLTATGNVQASYVLGDGSKLTNTVTTGKSIAMSIVFGG